MVHTLVLKYVKIRKTYRTKFICNLSQSCALTLSPSNLFMINKTVGHWELPIAQMSKLAISLFKSDFLKPSLNYGSVRLTKVHEKIQKCMLWAYPDYPEKFKRCLRKIKM